MVEVSNFQKLQGFLFYFGGGAHLAKTIVFILPDLDYSSDLVILPVWLDYKDTVWTNFSWIINFGESTQVLARLPGALTE